MSRSKKLAVYIMWRREVGQMSEQQSERQNYLCMLSMSDLLTVLTINRAAGFPHSDSAAITELPECLVLHIQGVSKGTGRSWNGSDGAL